MTDATASLTLARIVVIGVLLATCAATPGTAALVILAGLAVLALPAEAGWILAAAAASSLLWGADDPHHVAAPRWAALGFALVPCALVGLDPRAKWRLVAGGAALAIGAVAAAKQAVVAEVHVPGAGALAIPLFGAGFACAVALIGTPADPRVGVALIGAGALIAARAGLPQRMPGAEVRAAAPTDLLALGAIAAHPTDLEPGEQIARKYGADLALRVGWDPRDPVDTTVASDVAWTLEGWGHRERAVAFLRRQRPTGTAAFSLALLAREAGDSALADRAWAEATLPDGVPVDPRTLLAVTEWPASGAHTAWFAFTTPVDHLEVSARGTAWEGPPRLLLAIGGADPLALDVPDEGARAVIAGPFPPGAYRLIARFDNDASGPDGDRNLYDVLVTAVP